MTGEDRSDLARSILDISLRCALSSLEVDEAFVREENEQRRATFAWVYQRVSSSRPRSFISRY